MGITRKLETMRIINEVMLPNHIQCGTHINDCEICDNSISWDNPGREITYTKFGRKHIVHVCEDCYLDIDYLPIFMEYDDLKIKIYKGE